MDIQILEEKYHSIENSDSFSLHNEFIKELTKEDFQKMLEFHLKLIDDCRGNRDLHRRIYHAFEKRERDIAVQFLSEKLESLHNIGKYYFETGKYDKAIENWEKVVKDAGFRYFENEKTEYLNFYKKAKKN